MEDWHIVLGVREEWGRETPFVLSPRDRRHHLYAIGKSGTGKTTLLRNLILQDIAPVTASASLTRTAIWRMTFSITFPRHRIEDVTYFNPADTEFPVGFNLLGATPPDRTAFGRLRHCERVQGHLAGLLGAALGIHSVCRRRRAFWTAKM